MQDAFEAARARIAGAVASLMHARASAPPGLRVDDGAIRRVEAALQRALHELESAFGEDAPLHVFALDATAAPRGRLIDTLMLDAGRAAADPDASALTIRWRDDAVPAPSFVPVRGRPRVD